jgi:hypothetical protein
VSNNVIQGNFGTTGPAQTTPPGGGGGKRGSGSSAAVSRYDVWTLRHNKKRFKTKDAVVRALFNYIWNREVNVDGGSFILADDGTCFLLTGDTHQLYRVSAKDRDFCAHIWYKYGLLQTEQVTRHIMTSIEHYSRKLGRQRELRRFVHFCKRTLTLYVSRYDGTCWRIDGSGKWRVVPNGTGGALFIDDDGGVTVEDPLIGNHGVLLPTLTEELNYAPSNNGMDATSQKLALSTWLFATAFPDLMPAKPMLLVEGDRGSGKTTAIKMIQVALHGTLKTHNIRRNDENDFAIYVLRSPLCLLDNADSFVDWLQDTLCTYATGGVWTRRKLFTDSDQVELRPQSFIAITSRNPVTFKRDDVADRCIIVRMGRRTDFTPEAILMQQIEDKRHLLYGEWLWFLDQIVKRIRAGGLNKVPAGSFRMADFTAIAHVIGMAIGATKDEVATMLEGMEAERDTLVAEGDPLLDLLDKWLEDSRNVGKPITAAALFKALSDMARGGNRSFYKSPSTLAQKLRRDTVSKHFDVRQVGVQGNAKLYEIRRKSDK